MSIIFITHDLGVVAELCSRVVVMYGGLIMEEAPIDDLFRTPGPPVYHGSAPLDSERGRRIKPRSSCRFPAPAGYASPTGGLPLRGTLPLCTKRLRQRDAGLFTVGEGHRSMCWLLHPDAPAEQNPFKEVIR
jgi:oligopeptide transport system ATP-binding protein